MEIISRPCHSANAQLPSRKFQQPLAHLPAALKLWHMSLTLEPIATVHSCFGEKFAIPRQPGLCPSAWGTLTFLPEYRSPEACRGLEGFSHVWLIFGFHETLAQGWKPTVRPPRLGGNQRVGVFASRSPFRPNGLGLSLVKLDGITLSTSEGPQLRLSGLDLLDGTPIYDVKPYLPYAEALPEASSGFAQEAITRLSVEISDSAQAVFSLLPARSQAVLREVLALDPRPATVSPEESRIFGARLCGYNVRFSIHEDRCLILSLDAEEDCR
jgi:tRNA (adenine37-N6)-methyltransferase